MGGGGRFNLFAHRVTAIVKLHCYSQFILLHDHCNCLSVIKHGCFNSLEESVMQQQDGLPFLLTT